MTREFAAPGLARKPWIWERRRRFGERDVHRALNRGRWGRMFADEERGNLAEAVLDLDAVRTVGHLAVAEVVGRGSDRLRAAEIAALDSTLTLRQRDHIARAGRGYRGAGAQLAKVGAVAAALGAITLLPRARSRASDLPRLKLGPKVTIAAPETAARSGVFLGGGVLTAIAGGLLWRYGREQQLDAFYDPVPDPAAQLPRIRASHAPNRHSQRAAWS